MAYKRKIDRRFFDPALYHRHDGIKRLRRYSLSDPERIERLRWGFLIRWGKKYQPKIDAAWDKLEELGEAFFQRKDDAPGRPTRIVFRRDYHNLGGRTLSLDYGFWERPKEQISGKGPLRDLAEIGALKEWEEKELPKKLSRVTDEKLAAGAAYWKIDGYWSYRWTRVNRLNRLLVYSITELDILPEGRPHVKDRIVVRLNGRDYPFVRRYSYSEPLFKEWPEPDNEIPIITVPQFRIDESLLGKNRDVVRTRHGEPVETFASRKRDKFPNIWIYGAVGVRFNSQGVVEKILDHKAVTRILRTAK